MKSIKHEKQDDDYSIINNYVDLYNFKLGRIYLTGDIEDTDSDKIIPKLDYYYDNSYDLIHLYINSNGGDADEGYAIIDKINLLKKYGMKILTICTGKAYSAAADILAFGSERLGTENCKIMMHPAKYSFDYEELDKHSNCINFSNQCDEATTKRVANACGYKTVKRVQEFTEMIKPGLWMDAKQAIKAGVLDGYYSYEHENILIETNKKFVESQDNIGLPND